MGKLTKKWKELYPQKLQHWLFIGSNFRILQILLLKDLLALALRLW